VKVPDLSEEQDRDYRRIEIITGKVETRAMVKIRLSDK
jgi:hypothetical protein